MNEAGGGDVVSLINSGVWEVGRFHAIRSLCCRFKTRLGCRSFDSATLDSDNVTFIYTLIIQSPIIALQYCNCKAVGSAVKW